MENQELTPYEHSMLNFSAIDEVLKLSLIVRASKMPIYPSYLCEKLRRILRGIHIGLDGGKQAEYNELKRNKGGYE